MLLIDTENTAKGLEDGKEKFSFDVLRLRSLWLIPITTTEQVISISSSNERTGMKQGVG